MNTIHTKDKKRKYKLFFEVSDMEIRCYVFAKIDILPEGANAVDCSWLLNKGYQGFKEIDLVTPPAPMYVEKVQGEPGFFEFLGCAGLSEKVHDTHYKDYSYFELIMVNGRLTPWRNRYFFEPSTNLSSNKARYQWRASFNEVKVASVLIPFLEKDFSKYPIEMISAYEPIFVKNSRKITKRYDFIKDYGNVDVVRDFLWKVEGKSKVSVASNATAPIPVRMVWNKDGKLCPNSSELKVTCSSGYVPVRQVKFNKGEAIVQFHALGLPSGLQTDIHFFVHDRVLVGSIQVQIT